MGFKSAAIFLPMLLNWASTIENQDLRESMTQHTLGVWRRQNEEAARSWAAENGVDLPSAQPRGK